MLFWKFKMGLFDDPYVDPDEAERIVGCEENRRLALQAARETITLLKNENNLVPLNPRKIKSIAVIGPNADRELLGGYSGQPKFLHLRAGRHPRQSRRPRAGALFAKAARSPWAAPGTRIW